MQKHRLLSVLMACSVLWISTAVSTYPAMAAGDPLSASRYWDIATFDIPEQPLATALLQYAMQAQIQIVMIDVPGLVDDEKSVSIKGQFTSQEVLERLLSGSRYQYEITGPRTVVIKIK